MKINFIFKTVLFSDTGKKKLFRKRIRALVNEIAKEEKRDFGNISLIFCNDEFIKEYNRKFLGHDYETDIITFHDKDEEGRTEGELMVSVESVKSNSLKFKTKFNEEMLRVIIHGVLHLSGYNDKTNSEKIKIRDKENYYLKKSDHARKGN